VSGILFQNFKHPVARTTDFGGEAAWTDNRYKLVIGESRRAKSGPRTELYDLVADPNETTDIASKHPDIVRRMTAQLHAWQRSVERSLTGADYRTLNSPPPVAGQTIPSLPWLTPYHPS
jgi:hypothetical protein